MTDGLLLTCNSLATATLSTSVCLRSLAVCRQTLAVPDPTIGLDICETANVHLRLTAEITFDQHSAAVYSATHPSKIFLCKVSYSRILDKTNLVEDLLRSG